MVAIAQFLKMNGTRGTTHVTVLIQTPDVAKSRGIGRTWCVLSVGDAAMRKAGTRLPEQGTQAPSPAPDLIPARTENQPRTYTAIGTVNGGTSTLREKYQLKLVDSKIFKSGCVALRYLKQ